VAAREYEVESAKLAARKAAVTLRVFVGGPYIDPLWSDLPEDKASNLALVARFKIRSFITGELGHIATIGEEADMEKIYREHLSDFFEASTMEFAHVVEHCDAVVILPSSPGSFCELGYFAAADEISEKMLVILDSSFSKKRGYLHYGPSRQASLFGAEVIEEDYNDIDSLLEAVKKFLMKVHQKKMISKYRIRK